LVAVADPDRTRAEKAAQQFECKAYTSQEELLADKSVDVVNVLTPNHLHSQAVIAAAKAGKHVLVEKPPAMSLKDTDAMIRACKEAGVRLGVVLQCRVRKPIQAMRQAIAEGRFGRLIQADTFMKWHRTTEYYFSDPWRSSRRSGGGVTIQHAFHYIDLLQYLMGPAKRVEARMMNLTHHTVELEDTVHACIDYANGAHGMVLASTGLWPGSDVRVELHGENGTAVMVGERMEMWKFKEEQAGDEKVRALGRASVRTAASGPADFDFADHQLIIEDMADAIRYDEEPMIPAASARVTLEIVLALYQSASQGRPVDLPLVDEESIW